MKFLLWIISVSFFSCQTASYGSDAQQQEEQKLSKPSTFKGIRLYDQAILEKLLNKEKASKQTMRKATRTFTFLPDVFNLIARPYFQKLDLIGSRNFDIPDYGNSSKSDMYSRYSYKIEEYFKVSEEKLKAMKDVDSHASYMIGLICEYKYKNMQEAKRRYTEACDSEGFFRGIWGLDRLFTPEEKANFKFQGTVPYNVVIPHFLKIDKAEEDEVETIYKLAQTMKDMQCTKLRTLFLLTAGRLGHVEAQYQMSTIIGKDKLYWLILSTLGGSYEAAEDLVNVHDFTKIPEQKKWDPTIRWLPSIQKRADSDQGRPIDFFVLGLMYHRGIIVAKDMERASCWYKKALDAEPNNLILSWRYGGILCDMKRVEEGLPYVEKAKNLSDFKLWFYADNVARTKSTIETVEEAVKNLKQLALKGFSRALLSITKLKSAQFLFDDTFTPKTLLQLLSKEAEKNKDVWTTCLNTANLVNQKLPFLELALMHAPADKKDSTRVRIIDAIIAEGLTPNNASRVMIELEELRKRAQDIHSHYFLGKTYQNLGHQFCSEPANQKKCIEASLDAFMSVLSLTTYDADTRPFFIAIAENLQNKEIEKITLDYLTARANSHSSVKQLLYYLYQTKAQYHRTQADLFQAMAIQYLPTQPMENFHEQSLQYLQMYPQPNVNFMQMKVVENTPLVSSSDSSEISEGRLEYHRTEKPEDFEPDLKRTEFIPNSRASSKQTENESETESGSDVEGELPTKKTLLDDPDDIASSIIVDEDKGEDEVTSTAAPNSDS